MEEIWQLVEKKSGISKINIRQRRHIQSIPAMSGIGSTTFRRRNICQLNAELVVTLRDSNGVGRGGDS
jgi:hypothetical protein